MPPADSRGGLQTMNLPANSLVSQPNLYLPNPPACTTPTPRAKTAHHSSPPLPSPHPESIDLPNSPASATSQKSRALPHPLTAFPNTPATPPSAPAHPHHPTTSRPPIPSKNIHCAASSSPPPAALPPTDASIQP